jgi:hypothetical protein
MGIFNRIVTIYTCVLLAWGAVVTHRHHVAERQGAVLAEMAKIRASLPAPDDPPDTNVDGP